MIQLGQFNTLEIFKTASEGLYLGQAGEVFLPARDLPEEYDVKAKSLQVFVYLGDRKEYLATVEGPYALAGEFAHLKVVGVTEQGAFLDWGLRKDLFLPKQEQTQELYRGEEVIVFVRIDRLGKISATMRLQEKTEFKPRSFKVGEEVQLWIVGQTDLGYKAIVDEEHWGVIYHSDIFKPLLYAQITKGFIRKVREDGKLDLSLQRLGHKAGEDISPMILQALKEAGGFLPLHDRVDPQTVYEMFGVSKNKFKVALGGLYKRHLIKITDSGIEFVIQKKTD